MKMAKVQFWTKFYIDSPAGINGGSDEDEDESAMKLAMKQEEFELSATEEILLKNICSLFVRLQIKFPSIIWMNQNVCPSWEAYNYICKVRTDGYSVIGKGMSKKDAILDGLKSLTFQLSDVVPCHNYVCKVTTARDSVIGKGMSREDAILDGLRSLTFHLSDDISEAKDPNNISARRYRTVENKTDSSLPVPIEVKSLPGHSLSFDENDDSFVKKRFYNNEAFFSDDICGTGDICQQNNNIDEIEVGNDFRVVRKSLESYFAKRLNTSLDSLDSSVSVGSPLDTSLNGSNEELLVTSTTSSLEQPAEDNFQNDERNAKGGASPESEEDEDFTYIKGSDRFGGQDLLNRPCDDDNYMDEQTALDIRTTSNTININDQDLTIQPQVRLQVTDVDQFQWEDDDAGEIQCAIPVAFSSPIPSLNKHSPTLSIVLEESDEGEIETKIPAEEDATFVVKTELLNVREMPEVTFIVGENGNTAEPETESPELNPVPDDVEGIEIKNTTTSANTEASINNKDATFVVTTFDRSVINDAEADLSENEPVREKVQRLVQKFEEQPTKEMSKTPKKEEKSSENVQSTEPAEIPVEPVVPTDNANALNNSTEQVLQELVEKVAQEVEKTDDKQEEVSTTKVFQAGQGEPFQEVIHPVVENPEVVMSLPETEHEDQIEAEKLQLSS